MKQSRDCAEFEYIIENERGEHLFMLHSFSICDCAAQTLQTWFERTATGSDALHEDAAKESRNLLLRKQK